MGGLPRACEQNRRALPALNDFPQDSILASRCTSPRPASVNPLPSTRHPNCIKPALRTSRGGSPVAIRRTPERSRFDCMVPGMVPSCGFAEGGKEYASGSQGGFPRENRGFASGSHRVQCPPGDLGSCAARHPGSSPGVRICLQDKGLPLIAGKHSVLPSRVVSFYGGEKLMLSRQGRCR